MGLNYVGFRWFDGGIRFPICREGQLETRVREVGLKQVEAYPIVINTVFQNFDDYWQPFLLNVGPASIYVMSLTSEGRQKIEDKLHKALPMADDGSISLTARAWAVKGAA